VSPPAGTFPVGDHVPVTFSCISASNCQATWSTGRFGSGAGLVPSRGQLRVPQQRRPARHLGSRHQVMMVTGFAGGSTTWSRSPVTRSVPPAGPSGTTVDGKPSDRSAPSAAPQAPRWRVQLHGGAASGRWRHRCSCPSAARRSSRAQPPRRAGVAQGAGPEPCRWFPATAAARPCVKQRGDERRWAPGSGLSLRRYRTFGKLTAVAIAPTRWRPRECGRPRCLVAPVLRRRRSARTW
jgi:hypothetical protein